MEPEVPKEQVDKEVPQLFGKSLLEALKIAPTAHSASKESLKGLYEFAPFLPKKYWTEVGNQVCAHERLSQFNVPGDKWITLRLDGHGFSSLTAKLRRDGIMEKGYSELFASWMQACCLSLMDMMNAKCGYTQSDEISLIIPPASVTIDKGVPVQHPHAFNGRVLKICTLAASRVTVVFNRELSKVCPTWADYYITFDCRMASYDSLEEALSLFLWRTYDCGINGISDQCHHNRGAVKGAKEAVGFPTDKKLDFLAENNLLPLKEHQANGSYYTRVKRAKKVVNPKSETQEEVYCLRSVVEQVSGNLLNLAIADKLILPDEALEKSDSK